MDKMQKVQNGFRRQFYGIRLRLHHVFLNDGNPKVMSPIVFSMDIGFINTRDLKVHLSSTI